MASFRNHRIVIASLFLPTTAVLGESGPPTPEQPIQHPQNSQQQQLQQQGDAEKTIPAVATRLAAAVAASAAAGDAGSAKKPLKPSLITNASHTRQSSASGPLKSIVEDLKDKSRYATPSTRSPTNEAANPFTKLTRFALESEARTLTPSTARKHQTAHPESQSAPRLRRKQSRSSSRRAPSASGTPLSPTSNHSDLFDPAFQTWHVEPNGHCNGGLKNAVDSVGDRMRKKMWVGTLGTCTDGFGDDLRKDIDKRMLAQRSGLPVWIPDAEFQSCYDEFCHQVLWPCLHYAVPDAPKTKLFYESASYKQYVAVNQRFADAILANHQEGDIIWVNDYHLLLLPAMLRASPLLSPSTPIGFFMHVAFPSSEIFRCLSVRKDLLRGMLGADMVGFQTANYARHFRQTVSRILSFEALPKGIQVPEGEGLPTQGVAGEGGEGEKMPRVRDGVGERGRFVDVGVFPMGIDVKQLRIRKQEPEVAEWVQVLKQRYAGMKIVVGRDKLDEIQGVRHKLLAFEAFLTSYPEFASSRTVLIQVALQTTESNELGAGGIAAIVSRINSRFSTLTYQPVVFLHVADLTFAQYLALLSVADAFIVTSLREGMALRTHEYVECQEGRWRPLVLSEFTGSYSYSGFRSCIAVNPWDTRGTAAAIHQALTMGDEEARSRWEDLHNHVTTQTAQTFVTSFLNRCLRAHTEHSHSQQDADALAVPSLSQNLPLLLPRYKHSRKRLILIDFEGTLWQRDLSRAGLVGMAKGEYDFPEEAVRVLGKLADEAGGRNEVWLLSGLKVGEGVLERVRERVPRVGIVAENGCFIKTRAVGGGTGEWINMVANINLTWKSSCLEMLNYFMERTPGSFIEERQASVVWRFWTGEGGDCADRQWAQRQAAEAQNHIFDSLGERYGLRIIPGKNSFLVLPNNVSRSTAVGAILHPGGPARSPHSPLRSNSFSSNTSASSRGPIIHVSSSPIATASGGWMPSHDRSNSGFSTGVGGFSSSGGGFDGGFGNNGGLEDVDFLLAMSSDEKLLRRLNEFEGAETVSTSGRGKGTDAKWRMEGDCVGVLEGFAALG
ncbi:glycosyltransferase family 20-domain-containing protein [Crassisporium funariophilum]|nr:glycosyltransferase family 20-domain-containing protein [Crassisporium funariophilum]